MLPWVLFSIKNLKCKIFVILREMKVLNIQRKRTLAKIIVRVM